MTNSNDILVEITPQLLLKAYSIGIFPMAESVDDPGMFWVEPEMRGILPLNNFHIPRSLKKSFRRNDFEVKVDSNFEEVVAACAGEGIERDGTWINQRIRNLYSELFKMGHCHSVEIWHDEKLVGGLYGVSLGGAFFGESMFSKRTNASKFALIHLVYRLKQGKFRLLDTQFTTEHLERFGVVEILRDDYRGLLESAISCDADFFAYEGGATSEDILQSLSQIS
ncbi:MAG: leucyl/phenylalanyl-tRNA--protein transferase [Rhizobiaceae bacterium]